MVYLAACTFPDDGEEFDYCLKVPHNVYTSFYPFKVLSRHRLERVEFAPVTILYGGNGSGKSTALNVLAQKPGFRARRRITARAFLRTMPACAAWSCARPCPRPAA